MTEKKQVSPQQGLKISVYIDDGRIFYYFVPNAGKAREHSAAIIASGYRHNDGKGEYEHYPPHRLLKVKVSNGIVPTNYPDEQEGT